MNLILTEKDQHCTKIANPNLMPEKFIQAPNAFYAKTIYTCIIQKENYNSDK